MRLGHERSPGCLNSNQGQGCSTAMEHHEVPSSLSIDWPWVMPHFGEYLGLPDWNWNTRGSLFGWVWERPSSYANGDESCFVSWTGERLSRWTFCPAACCFGIKLEAAASERRLGSINSTTKMICTARLSPTSNACYLIEKRGRQLPRP